MRESGRVGSPTRPYLGSGNTWAWVNSRALPCTAQAAAAPVSPASALACSKSSQFPTDTAPRIGHDVLALREWRETRFYRVSDATSSDKASCMASASARQPTCSRCAPQCAGERLNRAGLRHQYGTFFPCPRCRYRCRILPVHFVSLAPMPFAASYSSCACCKTAHASVQCRGSFPGLPSSRAGQRPL